MKFPLHRRIQSLRVLVACEYSAVVRDAFRRRGHDAWSCDFDPSEGDPQFHYQTDVEEVLDQGWDLMIAHPPCFSGDTLVMTNAGFKRIDTIQVGEEVLTHNQRWRKVTKVMSRNTDKTLEVTVTGSFPIRTTEEHPFYTRERSWKSVNKRNCKVESLPSWTSAGSLGKGDIVGAVIPTIAPVDVDTDLLWLMGRYVADGHLRYRNGKYESVHFSIGKHKIEAFRKCCAYSFSEDDMPSAIRVSMYTSDFCALFAEFGRGAINKRIPGWVLALPNDQAKAFLEGYLSGDGYATEREVSGASISMECMLGISVLMRRVYKRAVSLHAASRKAKVVIEGREVNQNTSYSARTRIDATASNSTIDGDYTWNPFRKARPLPGCEVFNLSVEEDESYMVNNCIVHNCTHLAVSGARHFAAKRADGRQQAALEFVRLLLEAPIPRIALENPVSIISSHFRKPEQVIQPWQFGHGETKATCLWLENLPKLRPTNIVSGRHPRIHLMAPSPTRAKERSKTYQGIANAMASQWGILGRY